MRVFISFIEILSLHNLESMEKYRNKGIVFTLLIAAGIFVLSIIPPDIAGQQKSMLFPGFDKIIHAIMYGTLTFFALNEYRIRLKPAFLTLLLILLSVWVYSILMELIQFFFINSRSGDFLDALANLAGILFVTALMLGVKRIKF